MRGILVVISRYRTFPTLVQRYVLVNAKQREREREIEREREKAIGRHTDTDIHTDTDTHTLTKLALIVVQMFLKLKHLDRAAYVKRLEHKLQSDSKQSS